ncbi:MAG: cobalt-precorrin-6A reductase [Acetobacteraceae bacterium]|nr:cobalt-precorrin-6A reductase [Acetobacteraceae bacterium]
MPPLKVLILGGSAEASALARELADDPRYHATLSLAGRTRLPALPPIAYRIGGFGGVSGLIAYLQNASMDAIIDATHPFAHRISSNAIAAAKAAAVPFLAIRRPAWRPEPSDRWEVVADLAAAAKALGETPKRVFLTIGRNELAPFREAPWHFYLIRSVEAPELALLPPRAEVITARGPFAAEAEQALLLAHGIEVLVTKNSGGSATYGKILAARQLGLPVVMVARPPLPEADSVEEVGQALAWLAQLHARRAAAFGEG